MRDLFTVEEVVSLMREECFNCCFQLWGKPESLRETFRNEIYGSELWTKTFIEGFYQGALYLNELENLSKNDIAKFQNIKYYLCLKGELSNG